MQTVKRLAPLSTRTNHLLFASPSVPCAAWTLYWLIWWVVFGKVLYYDHVWMGIYTLLTNKEYPCIGFSMVRHRKCQGSCSGILAGVTKLKNKQVIGRLYEWLQELQLCNTCTTDHVVWDGEQVKYCVRLRENPVRPVQDWQIPRLILTVNVPA